MGGIVPIGHDHKDRQLNVNEVEAERVRQIFAQYLRFGSVFDPHDYLKANGYRSKQRVRLDERSGGDSVLSRGTLHTPAQQSGLYPLDSTHGNGLDPLWPLMRFAPLPLLAFALRSKWWATAMVTVAVMLLGNLNILSYFTKTLGMPGSTWVGIFLVAGVVFAGGVLLFRVLVLRGAVWSGLVALPALWVTSEYFRNFTTPHGSAGSLAYSRMRFLLFLQLASITGPWGMSFVILVLPAAIAIGLHLSKTSPKRALQLQVPELEWSRPCWYLARCDWRCRRRRRRGWG
jgi:hypothetical protein